MVVVGALVGAIELPQDVGLRSTLVLLDYSEVSRHLGDNTGCQGRNHVASVNRREGLHAGSHQRGLGAQQGHCLTLHVRTHEGTVRIVVLEERNQRGSNRNHLTGRNIYVVDRFWANQFNLSTLLTDQNAVHREGSVSIQRGTGLSHNEFVLVVGGQVVNCLTDLALGHASIRSLNEPKRVDTRKRREGTNQTNVRAFRGFDGTHAAVVRRVNVTDLNAGTLTAQTAGAQCRETTLVSQT